MERVYVHPTAEVADDAQVGAGTHIWNQAQVRSGAQIGTECNIGKNVYIDRDVTIGSRVKIQNNVSVYHGVTIEDGVFIGPHVCFTNDVHPRAITPLGTLKGQDDWVVAQTYVGEGASIGAGSIILPGISIGRFAMIGAGSVVTHPVPEYGLFYGNPARQKGYVCPCGGRIANIEQVAGATVGTCEGCHEQIILIGGQVETVSHV